MSILENNYYKSVLLLAALILVWLMKTDVMILLGSILFAIIISGLINLISEKFKISRFKSIGVFIGVVLLISFLFIFSLLPLVQGQAQQFLTEFPQTYKSFQSKLESFLGFKIPISAFTSETRNYARQAIIITFNTFTYFLLMIVLGFYMGIDSKTYLKIYDSGIQKNKQKLKRISQNIYADLNLWFYARLVSMFIVTILVSVGLFFIGIPYYFFFGLLSGVLSFVPNIGPFLAFLPAFLVSLTIKSNYCTIHINLVRNCGTH